MYSASNLAGVCGRSLKRLDRILANVGSNYWDAVETRSSLDDVDCDSLRISIEIIVIYLLWRYEYFKEDIGLNLSSLLQNRCSMCWCRVYLILTSVVSRWGLVSCLVVCFLLVCVLLLESSFIASRLTTVLWFIWVRKRPFLSLVNNTSTSLKRYDQSKWKVFNYISQEKSFRASVCVAIFACMCFLYSGISRSPNATMCVFSS